MIFAYIFGALYTNRTTYQTHSRVGCTKNARSMAEAIGIAVETAREHYPPEQGYTGHWGDALQVPEDWIREEAKSPLTRGT